MPFRGSMRAFAMAFRETSAWISLVTTILVYGYYFWNVQGTQGANGAALLGLLIGCVAILAVLQIIFHVAAAIRSPRDALTPQDERERQIAQRSASLAYYIVAGGAVLAAMGLMFAGNAFAM